MMFEPSHPPLKKCKSLCFYLKLGMEVKKNTRNLTKKKVMSFIV